MLRIEDFCRSTGLEQDIVEHLVQTGRLEGALWREAEESRPFGIFDDVLPARESLVAMGLPVKDDYEPDALRSFEMTENDDDPEAE